MRLGEGTLDGDLPPENLGRAPGNALTLGVHPINDHLPAHAGVLQAVLAELRRTGRLDHCVEAVFESLHQVLAMLIVIAAVDFHHFIG